MDFNQIRDQLLDADLNKGLQVRVGVLQSLFWSALALLREAYSSSTSAGDD